MDILMTYWNSVWRTAIAGLNRASHDHSEGEWDAYNRSLKRRNPCEGLMRGILLRPLPDYRALTRLGPRRHSPS